MRLGLGFFSALYRSLEADPGVSPDSLTQVIPSTGFRRINENRRSEDSALNSQFKINT